MPEADGLPAISAYPDDVVWTHVKIVKHDKVAAEVVGYDYA
jgi:hypothetical protein